LDLVPAVIGLVVGVVVGLTSTGGGALLTPALILVLGVPPGLAVGTDVLIASGMKLVGSGFYSRRGHVHFPTVLRLAVGSLPGAGVGLLLLRSVPAQSLDGFLRGALGIALLMAGGATLLRLRRPEGGPVVRSAPRTPVTVALGFLTGVLVSVTSIGSGSLLLCVLALFFPLSAPTMVGTDLAHALLLSTVAALGHLAAGRVDFALAGGVLLGALPGVWLGARFATAVPERALRIGLAALLLLTGLNLSLTSGTVSRPAAAQEVRR
jgi:uncharacterized membrane protein YfcA